MERNGFILVLSMYCSSGLWADLENFVKTFRDTGVSMTEYYRIKQNDIEEFYEMHRDKTVFVFPRKIVSTLKEIEFPILDTLLNFVKKEKLDIPGIDTVKVKKTKLGFIEPSINEVFEYMREVSKSTHFATIESTAFFDHYSSVGWKTTGGAAIKDWKAACRKWERNNFNKTKKIPDNTVNSLWKSEV